MRQLKRLFYYLLINIIVSAVTVVVVLNWWESRDTLPIQASPTNFLTNPALTAAPSSASNETSEQSPPPTESQQVTSVPQPPTPTLELITYQVQSGDTLGSIAVAFETTMADILAVNTIDNPDQLSVGQTIYIPTGPVPIQLDTPSASPTAVSTPTLTPTPKPTLGPSPTSTPTLTGQEPQVTIVTVIGSGDLAAERVLLKRTGEGELSLANWWLVDDDGNVYFFPQLTLYKDGAVNLHTSAGQNTVVDLYWGLTTPVWSSGETVILFDALGNERATYTIP